MTYPFRSVFRAVSGSVSGSARTLAISVVLAVAVLPTVVSAQDASPEDLIAQLQEGGLVLYIRHAQTEADYADQVTAVVGDCSTQRMLSAAGWAQARAIGGAVAGYGIPVSEVISGEYCRAWQTADLAFGHHVRTPVLNFEPSEEYTPEQVAAMSDRVTPFLATPVVSGNRVIVGHDDPFEAATGIYPEPQGVAYVLRPDGAGGFAVLGHIAPDAW